MTPSSDNSPAVTDVVCNDGLPIIGEGTPSTRTMHDSSMSLSSCARDLAPVVEAPTHAIDGVDLTLAVEASA
ncbi:hypothetical protein V6N11_035032 [Hibiscus sabdariffa]